MVEQTVPSFKFEVTKDRHHPPHSIDHGKLFTKLLTLPENSALYAL